MSKKRKSVWLYLDGKKHCDVVMWGLAANMDLQESKKKLAKMYSHLKIEFKIQ